MQKEPTPNVILSGKTVAEVPALEQNLSDHKFKDNRQVETDVKRWLMTNTRGNVRSEARRRTLRTAVLDGGRRRR